MARSTKTTSPTSLKLRSKEKLTAVKTLKRFMRLPGRHRTSGEVKYGHRSNWLLLDWDDCPLTLGEITIRLLQLNLYPPAAISWQRSQKRSHWHGVIVLSRRLPLLAGLFSQLYLGSDPRRESQGFKRVLAGDRGRFVQVLFERKI